VQNHYDYKGEENVEISLEKLQVLVTSCVDAFQKVMWLTWWNVKHLVQKNLKFPDTKVSNADFIKWLHKAIFWG
jgi:hypothetical protein